jgi:hypothetical protein
MSYRTVLVHVDAGQRWLARLQLAIHLALRFEAHLVGLFVLSSARVPVNDMAEVVLQPFTWPSEP